MGKNKKRINISKNIINIIKKYPINHG